MRSKRILGLLIAVTLLATLGASAADAPEPAPKPTLKPQAKMVTSLGDIVIELDGEKAPITVQNFVRYAEEGFYNGTVFHRVMHDFMIQAGQFDVNMDKKEKGVHDPIKNEGKNGLKNVRGSIAMARTTALDSATAQFFINVVDNIAGSPTAKTDLDNPSSPYAVFGKVVKGIETVDEIRNTPVRIHPKYPSREPVTPVTMVVITAVTLLQPLDKEAIKTQIAKNAALEVNELKLTIAKLEGEHKTKFKTAPSGLMYAALKAGTGASPKPTDTVVVNYRGTRIDGSEFDSGESVPFPLNGVIKGFSEGIGMMKVGGKSLLVIPPELGYGNRGPSPGKALVFEIDLLDVK